MNKLIHQTALFLTGIGSALCGANQTPQDLKLRSKQGEGMKSVYISLSKSYRPAIARKTREIREKKKQ